MKVFSRRNLTFAFLTLLMLILVIIRGVNYYNYLETRSDFESLFRGVFTTAPKGETDESVIAENIDLCIMVYNENQKYDEKCLRFFQNHYPNESFNYYYIRYPEDTLYNEENQTFLTIWNLCRYDGTEYLILLNDKNEVKGSLQVDFKKSNLLGKYEAEYYLTLGDKTMSVWKRRNTPYSAGISYLESKYYSGRFLE